MDLERRLYEALKNHLANPKSPKPDLFKEPPAGVVRQTQHGPIWMVETSFDEGYLHGRIELSARMPDSVLELLDPICHQRGFAFDKVAVIDTETTGLAGGTGTYPFIIGVGFWSNGRFVVRQYILRDFFEEPAQLAALTSDLIGTNSILTYNGKTFDIPLLKTRFRINRMDIPFVDHIHFDFLHPCRRLYRRHYDSLNLTNLETKILGYERIEDVPSHLIPRLYFDYLQNRDDNLLLPILNHNREDIIGLYILVQETFRRVEMALSRSSDDDFMMLSIGQVLYKAGLCERTRDILSCIKHDYSPRDIVDESLMLLSRAAKKMKDWPTAGEIWEKMLRTGRFGCYPLIELAKLNEHRLKDCQKAFDLTSSAMQIIEFEREFISASKYKVLSDSLKTRRQRLLKKLDKI
jgi:uncharacterized protein